MFLEWLHLAFCGYIGGYIVFTLVIFVTFCYIWLLKYSLGNHKIILEASSLIVLQLYSSEIALSNPEGLLPTPSFKPKLSTLTSDHWSFPLPLIFLCLYWWTFPGPFSCSESFMLLITAKQFTYQWSTLP